MQRALLLFLLCYLPWQGIGGASTGNRRYILIKDGFLHLRQAPVSGKPIGRLKAGETVTVLRGDENWAYVKTSRGQSGYVAERYLGKLPPAELKNAEWWALAEMWSNSKPWARPLGFRLGERYYGGEYVAETLYLMNTSREPLALYQNGKLVGKAQISSAATYGCGEHPAWQLSLPSLGDTIAVLYPGRAEVAATLFPAQQEPALTAILEGGDGWQTIAAQIIQLKSAGRYLYVHRRRETGIPEAEVSRRYEWYELNAVSGEAILFLAEEVQLSLEVDAYGGAELLGILPSRQGTLLLLFAQPGYDSIIYQIKTLRNKKMLTLFQGGGDAC